MAATSAMATDVELKLRVWVNKTNIFEEVLKFSSILGSFLDSLRVGGMWGGREGPHSRLMSVRPGLSTRSHIERL